MKELEKKIINYKEHQFRMLKSDQARSKFSFAEEKIMGNEAWFTFLIASLS